MDAGTQLVVAGAPKSSQSVQRFQELKLFVNVCGRTIAVSDKIQTLMELQSALQDELGMPDQVFEVQDNWATPLLMDMDFREAIAQGRVPLFATLSDASIHFIENRREELAQMQWKLVRDQHNQTSTKQNLISRQMTDLESRMELQKHSLNQAITQLRTELLQAVEIAKDMANSSCRQINERLAGVGQMVQAERNMREVAIEKFNKSIQSIHDTIDHERSVRDQGHSLSLSHIEGARKLIEVEREAREVFEDKQQRDVVGLTEKIDETANTIRFAMAEYARMFEKASQESTENALKYGAITQKLRSEIDATTEALAARLRLMEDRFTTIETRLNEANRRHTEHADRVAQRHDKVASHLEEIKFHGGQQDQTLENMYQKFLELEDALANTDQSLRDGTDRERKLRQEELTSLRQAIHSEQERLRQSLEGKIQVTIGGESHARQELRQQIFETVEKIIASRKQSIKKSTDLASASDDSGLSALGSALHTKGVNPPSTQKSNLVLSKTSTILASGTASPPTSRSLPITPVSCPPTVSVVQPHQGRMSLGCTQSNAQPSQSSGLHFTGRSGPGSMGHVVVPSPVACAIPINPVPAVMTIQYRR